MILIQFRELDELDQAVASIEEDGRFVVVPETEELEDKSREETYEDDDKENERMEHENYKVEEQSGNILTDKTNRLNAQKSGEGEEEKVTKLFRFPLGTIKKLVKLDEDVHMASQDAVFIISKASELFIETLSTEAFSFTSKNKKKTIQKNDVDTAIETTEALAFLDGAMED